MTEQPKIQHVPPGTQENYNRFSSGNPITEKGKESEYPEGAGGGKGEPGVPPTKISRRIIENYRTQLNKFIITSRFTNATWSENEQYRARNKNIGCIYCAPELIASNIPLDSILFVLEMNNDTNKIMGIGLVRNHAYSGLHRVYADGNYNRYVYVGKMRLSRQDFTEQEEKVFQIMDKLLFTGTRHMKRGHGLKAFPINTLYECSQKKIDLVNYVSTMFKTRMLENK